MVSSMLATSWLIPTIFPPGFVESIEEWEERILTSCLSTLAMIAMFSACCCSRAAQWDEIVRSWRSVDSHLD